MALAWMTLTWHGMTRHGTAFVNATGGRVGTRERDGGGLADAQEQVPGPGCRSGPGDTGTYFYIHTMHGFIRGAPNFHRNNGERLAATASKEAGLCSAGGVRIPHLLPLAVSGGLLTRRKGIQGIAICHPAWSVFILRVQQWYAIRRRNKAQA